MSKSKIEWTQETWNPFVGCSRVSDGCKNCYAEIQAHRLELMGVEQYKGLTVKGANGQIRWTGETRFVPNALTIPLKKKKPTTCFVCSMSDLFHESNSFDDIDKVFAVMAACPQHTFQALTKRPKRALEYLSNKLRQTYLHKMLYDLNKVDNIMSLDVRMKANVQVDKWPLPNVWLGTSVENQQTANERIPYLLQCPAAVRFLSCEPLLGVIDLTALEIEKPYDLPDVDGKTEYVETINALTGDTESEEFGFMGSEYPKVDWAIIGAESGSNARPMNLDHARSLRDQCVEAGVAFFYKQGNNKGKDGDRLLDGREWNEMPNQKGDQNA